MKSALYTLHGSELVFEGNIFDVIERLLKKSLSQYDFLGKPKSYFFFIYISCRKNLVRSRLSFYISNVEKN